MSEPLVVDRISALRSQVEQKKAEAARWEARMEQCVAGVASLREEMKAAGVDPANLDAEIQALEKQLDERLFELERALNG